MRAQVLYLAAVYTFCASFATVAAEHTRTPAFAPLAGAPTISSLRSPFVHRVSNGHVCPKGRKFGLSSAAAQRPALVRLSMSVEVDEEQRLLGSRRLAAAKNVIKDGTDDEESELLLLHLFLFIL